MSEKAKLALMIIVGIAYAVSPIDIIPDVIPILGWLDDLAVIGGFGVAAVNKLRSA